MKSWQLNMVCRQLGQRGNPDCTIVANGRESDRGGSLSLAGGIVVKEQRAISVTLQGVDL